MNLVEHKQISLIKDILTVFSATYRIFYNFTICAADQCVDHRFLSFWQSQSMNISQNARRRRSRSLEGWSQIRSKHKAPIHSTWFLSPNNPRRGKISNSPWNHPALLLLSSILDCRLSLSLSLNTMLCILSSHWPQLERVYMASDLACRKKIGKSSTMPFPTPCYACSLLIGHSKKVSTWHLTWHVGRKSVKSVPRCHRQEANTCCVYCKS